VFVSHAESAFGMPLMRTTRIEFAIMVIASDMQASA